LQERMGERFLFLEGSRGPFQVLMRTAALSEGFPGLGVNKDLFRMAPRPSAEFPQGILELPRYAQPILCHLSAFARPPPFFICGIMRYSQMER